MTEKKWPKLSRNDPKLNSMRFLVLECKLGDDLVFEMRLCRDDRTGIGFALALLARARVVAFHETV